jgi:hypothetical protein
MKFLLLFFLPLAAAAQEPRELTGKVGKRSAILVLHTAQRPDGSAQVAGEYVIFPTLVRRYVEGERSPELGVTVLKEGVTPILFGRPPMAELRGIWREGTFKGTRLGPGGQKREEFEFSEEFPSLENHSVSVRCEATQGRYRARLRLAVEKGRLKNLEWRSVEPGGQSCTLAASAQEAMQGGLRFVSGACRITLRDAGEFLALRAENCAAHCEADGHIGALFIDRRGNCELLP